MYDFHRHHTFFDGIIRLTEEEQENPAEVIARFFQEYHLSGIRKELTDMVLTFISGDDEETETDRYPFQRACMLAFHQELEKLLEAVYIQSGLQRKAA